MKNSSQMVLADKVLNARRQQQRLIDRPGPEGLAHKQTESNSSKRRHHNPLLSRRLLGRMISRNAPPPDSFTALREYRRRDSNLAILARPLTPANGER